MELHYLSAVDTLHKINNKSITVEEVIVNLLDRIRTINEKINALVQYDEEELLSLAREADEDIARNRHSGPLFGLPVSIKDNIEVKGMVTTGGIKGRKNFVPSYDATVVKRLRDAGAIILGKTNCPAFCAGYETENEVYGLTNNPYHLDRTVGSSSGGEAALIAAGGSYLGLGSDTGGSIRWPSSFCGIASLVPTFGRVPRTGTIPPYLGFLDTTQIGPMARSVKDLILAFQCIMGPDNWDPRCIPMSYETPDDVSLNDLQVAYYDDNGFVTPEPAIKRVVSVAADALSENNVAVKADYPDATREFIEVTRGLNSFSLNIDPGTKPDIHELEEPVELYPNRIYDLADEWKARSKQARGEKAMLAVEYHFRSVKWDTYRSEIMRFMNNYDAIICPVSAKPAFKHGYSSRKGFNELDMLSYTHPYSFVGYPSVTLRGGETSDGLPVSFQIITEHGKEGLALKIGLYLEEELGGWRKPEI